MAEWRSLVGCWLKINVLEVIPALAGNDVDSLIAALDLSPLSLPTPVKGGWSDTRLWRVELPGGPHLLRVYARHDELIALREAAVLDYLRAFDFPVARVVARGSNGMSRTCCLVGSPGRRLGRSLAGAVIRGCLASNSGACRRFCIASKRRLSYLQW